MNKYLLSTLLLFTVCTHALADDARLKVDFPRHMADHMLANMRDHLVSLEKITRHLAKQQYDQAADIAENRLGMSSLELHGASHMGKFMPEKMALIGTQMHKAASRFAIAAKDAELVGGLNAAFSALSEVMQQCVACHSAYRVH